MLFDSGKLPAEWDVMGCVVNIPSERIPLPSDISFNVSTDALSMHKVQNSCFAQIEVSFR